jgi:hypothetical protein
MTVKATLNIVVGGGFIDIWVGRFIFRRTRPYICPNTGGCYNREEEEK